MRDIRVKNRLVVFDFKRQRFAGMTIRCRNDRVGMQRGRNSVRVPNTIRVVTLAVSFDRKRGRDSRKRRRHPNTRRIARLRYEQSLGVKTSKSVEHVRFVDVDLARYLQGVRNDVRYQRLCHRS